MKFDERPFLHRTTFIAGSEKNAGKTTFLNFLLGQVRQRVAPAFLTIGVDGESRDLIFDTPKPQIRTEANDWLVTTEAMLSHSNALFEIREVFPVKTTLGRLVLARTLRPGQVELIGPETNEQLGAILRHIRDQQGVHTILVDGAASRVTQISSEMAGSCVYVLKVTPRTLKSSLDKLRRLDIMDSIPLYEPGPGEESTLLIEGAFTNDRAAAIDESITHLVLQDFTKVFVDWVCLKNLCAGRRVSFMNRFSLQSVAAILMDVKEDEFLERIQGLGIREKLIFNPYFEEEKGEDDGDEE